MVAGPIVVDGAGVVEVDIIVPVSSVTVTSLVEVVLVSTVSCLLSSTCLETGAFNNRYHFNCYLLLIRIGNRNQRGYN